MLDSQPEAVPQKLVFATDSVRREHRDAFWRETVCRVYGGLTITGWLNDGPVRGRLLTMPFAGGSASECRQRAVKLMRDSRDIARVPGDHYNLVLQVRGNGRMRHAGNECIRQPGYMTVMDSLLRYDGEFTDDLCVQVWQLPRRILGPMLCVPETAVGRLIDGNGGIGLLLRTMLQTAWPMLGNLDLDQQRGLQESLCRLTALAVGANAQARETSRGAYHQALLQRALCLIESRLSDQALTVEGIANHLQISRRQLEFLFEQRGLGVARWIGRRRIEECRRLLEDPAQNNLSVATIAFQAGFTDLSTFNRRFRSHYGITPRDVREVGSSHATPTDAERSRRNSKKRGRPAENA